MQDSALQCERDAQTKPYLYKERDVLLAHEDNRRENLRLRELHGALSYTRAGIYLHELYE